ncbi:helix-turn-helix domain-containing protein [Oceanobacillus jeddahense]|uniref:helix-turn-helix domain-containing protein n=1 Tax=Oceanobacillus jeddahense TaxID=1462527 RepID=UPI000694DFDB|nr:helix-turn-helix transcriptional regulator [Oceanobacillus jeddahense]
MKGFGLRLENLREKHGYSRVEISYKLGFSQNVYGSYEREKRRPSLETIIKLADIFGVSLDYLIRGEEYHSNDNDILKDLLAEVALEKGAEYQSDDPLIPEDLIQLMKAIRDLNPEARRKLIDFVKSL